MPFDRQQVLPSDALDQLACRLLAEARAQHPQKPLGKPIVDLGDDVGTNLLAWLLDIYDDALPRTGATGPASPIAPEQRGVVGDAAQGGVGCVAGGGEAATGTAGARGLRGASPRPPAHPLCAALRKTSPGRT